MKTLRISHPLASLAVAAALAGCGGGADKDSKPAPPPAPTAPVGVSLNQPASNVLEANASAPLSANVTVSGSTAPNGTTVTFTLNPANAGTLAPVAPSTVAGVAATTLSLASLPPGATFQVTATAASSANTASDHLTYYVRPAPRNMQVLVPAYFSATGTASPWATLTSGAASYPDVPITAIANPGNGALVASSKADADLATAITDFKAVPGTANKVVGYVATASGSSGAISVADVKTTIANYLRLYPDQLDGFFLDGMSSDSARLAYFQEIYTYVKGLGATLEVIGNPGTYPVAAYAGVADVLVTYAGIAAAYQGIDPQPANAWVYAQGNSAQALLAHTASTCTDMQATVQKAHTPRMNTGMVYVTNLAIGTPWSALPTYWQQLLGTVDALNKGRTVPAC